MKIYPIKNYENIVCSTLEGYSLTRHARLYESDKLVGFFTKKYNFFSRIVNSELVLSDKSYEFIYNMNNISILLNGVEFLKFDIVMNKTEREYL